MDVGDDIKTLQWVRDCFDGLRVYHTSYTKFEFPKHFHNYYTIQVVDRGVNKGFTDRLQYELVEDSVLIINPGELHAGKSANGRKLEFTVIAIEEFFLKRILLDNEISLNTTVTFTNRPIYDNVVASKIRSLVSDFRSGSTRLRIEVALVDCIFELMKYAVINVLIPHQKTNTGYLSTALEFIKENYGKDLKLSDIASTCGISEYHLVRQFKIQIGQTPFEYLRNFRVEKARELLKENTSITQVALQVGFYDHSHFLKNFKRITGMLPRQSRG